MPYTQRDLVRLHSGIGGMTPKLIRQILRQTHAQDTPLDTLFTLSKTELNANYGISDKVADALLRSTEEGADNTLAQLQEKRFRIVTFLDADYPAPLNRFGDEMPPLLYIHGDPALLNAPGVGFGGSRNVSTEGLHAADELARSAIDDYGMTVISGHAKGVDLIAHQSALAAKGKTVLVLPEGALIFRLNADLRPYWAEAADRILIVTQFAPNEPWSARNAMTRNGTAIGLAHAFCVIESGDEQGGTWAAGVTALRMKVPLYVLDYVTAPKSAAGNARLIANGAAAIPHQPQLKLPDIRTTSIPARSQKDDSAQPINKPLF